MQKKSKFDRLVLISSPDISRGVYESHVLSFIESLKNEYDLKFALVSFGKEKLSSVESSVLNERKVKINNLIGEENLLILRNRSIFNIKTQKERIETFIEKYRNNDEELIIICQNYYTGFIGTLLKKQMGNIHLHVDFKGIVPEEHLMYGESNVLVNLLSFVGAKIFERSIFRHADSFSAISNTFKSYFEKEYEVGIRPFLVLPSAVDTDKFFYDNSLRQKYRDILGYDVDNVVIAYAGSLQKWQRPDTIFAFFAEFNEYDRYRFLVLTFDKEKADKLLSEYSLPAEKIKILSVSPLEVNGHLNASDICLLIRKDDIVNNVASPTKFGEYLITRNKIVISKAVGDFSNIVSKSNFGICLDSNVFNIEEVLKDIEQANYPTNGEIDNFKKLYSMDSNIKKLGDIL